MGVGLEASECRDRVLGLKDSVVRNALPMKPWLSVTALVSGAHRAAGDTWFLILPGPPGPTAASVFRTSRDAFVPRHRGAIPPAWRTSALEPSVTSTCLKNEVKTCRFRKTSQRLILRQLVGGSLSGLPDLV